MKTKPSDTLIETALSYLQAGLSIIPTGQDKRPTLPEWTPYQREKATPEQVKTWFSNGTHNIAVIGGAVSGNLEVLDFDFRAEALKEWSQTVGEQAPGLFSKLIFEKSPKGVHMAYRVQGMNIPGNSKLARKAVEVAGPGEHLFQGKTLQAQQVSGKWVIIPAVIETRGEGGYCLIYPSRGYDLKQGSFADPPTITPEEREILIEAARACNSFHPPQEVNQGLSSNHQGGKLPGQEYDERGDLRELLSKHGWTKKGNGTDGREKWARPGKENGKASSATLTDGKILYVFSSNAHPFEPGRAYGPFGVYALLEHKGDFQTATKALAAQGYGTKSQQPEQQRRGFVIMTTNQMAAEFGKEVEFLWRDYIPKAAPCLFAGREKNGKSSTVAQISKEIVLQDPNALVVWIATEGFVSDHVDKWTKLRMPDRVVMLRDDKGNFKLGLDRWKDLDFVDMALRGIKEQTGKHIAAVVIDSVRGMQSVGENDPKIAQIISNISSIVCDKYKAACIFIAHHKKGQASTNVDKVAGGTGITSSIRALYTVQRISEFICKITPDASNALGHEAKSYKSILIKGDDGFDISIIEDGTKDEGSLRAKAEQFLISAFRESEKWKSTDLYERAAAEGLGSDILKKAKSNMPIKVYQEKFGEPWFWECPLYIQNVALWGETAKSEDKKPNKISQGDESDENFEESARVTRVTRVTDKNDCHSGNISNAYNKLVPSNPISIKENLSEEDLAHGLDF